MFYNSKHQNLNYIIYIIKVKLIHICSKKNQAARSSAPSKASPLCLLLPNLSSVFLYKFFIKLLNLRFFYFLMRPLSVFIS